MITQVKAVIDLIIKAEETTEKKKVDFFKNIINPLFEQITQIQKDYRTSFEKIQINLKNHDVTKGEFLSMLAGAKGELKEIRNIAQSIGESLYTNDWVRSPDESIRNFGTQMAYLSTDIKSYFTLDNGKSSFTTIEDLVEYFLEDDPLDQVVDPEIPHFIVNNILIQLNRNWEKICNHYAALQKITYL